MRSYYFEHSFLTPPIFHPPPCYPPIMEQLLVTMRKARASNNTSQMMQAVIKLRSTTLLTLWPNGQVVIVTAPTRPS